MSRPYKLTDYWSDEHNRRHLQNFQRTFEFHVPFVHQEMSKAQSSVPPNVIVSQGQLPGSPANRASSYQNLRPRASLGCAQASSEEREVDGGAFEGEKFRFGGGPAWSGEAAKLSTGRRNAMARDDDRHGILCHGLTDFLSGCGLAYRLGNLTVSACLSGRNFPSRIVNLPRKRIYVAQIHSHTAKVLSVPLKMTANL